MKRSYLFVSLVSLTALGCSSSNPEPTKSENTFVFKSDYCVLDNKEVYESNTQVDLNLSIDNKYKDTYLLPNDIEVLLGSRTGVINQDYSYIVKEDKKSASLSMTVNANIVVHVMYNDSDNIHMVTEEQFNTAIAMENIPFIQHEYEFYRYYYGGDSTVNLNRIDYISPSINYHFVSNIISSSGIKDIQTDPRFYSIDSDGKWRYDYDKENKKWEKEAFMDGDTFLVSADISPKKDTTISGYLTYDHLKNNYHQETSLYNYEVIEEKSGNKYIFTLSFDRNRLMSLSYETNADNGYLCYISYTYFAIVPELPQVDK